MTSTTVHLALAVCLLALLSTHALSRSAEVGRLRQKRLALFDTFRALGFRNYWQTPATEEVASEPERLDTILDSSMMTMNSRQDNCNGNISRQFSTWFASCQGKSLDNHNCLGITFCNLTEGGLLCENRTQVEPLFASVWYDCHGSKAQHSGFQCGMAHSSYPQPRLAKFYLNCRVVACLPSCSSSV